VASARIDRGELGQPAASLEMTVTHLAVGPRERDGDFRADERIVSVTIPTDREALGPRLDALSRVAERVNASQSVA
jgi:hypothetical protein